MNQQPRDWNPVADGERYCSPACGRGCTREEYDAARKGAQELREQLPGDAWKPVVWENLGWHYAARLTGADNTYIEVHPEPGGRFWVEAILPLQLHGTYQDPAKGVRDVLAGVKVIERHADILDTLMMEPVK